VAGRREWFFNPFAWQVIFVLGFVLAKDDGIGGVVQRNIKWLQFVAIPIVVAGAWAHMNDLLPDPTDLPERLVFFVIDSKSYASPPRLIQFLALAAMMSGTFPYIRRFAASLANLLSMLGRNSLPVFCVSSLLSLGAQFVRLVYEGFVSVDTIVVFVGVAIMALTAWLSEWRDRARAQVPALPVRSS
jgi:hypothetical protein